MHVLWSIIVRACTMIIVHACTMIIIHACTRIIVHACTMIIVLACTMIIVYACTMSMVHACTNIIVHAHSTCMYYDHSICMYYEHSTWKSIAAFTLRLLVKQVESFQRNSQWYWALMNFAYEHFSSDTNQLPIALMTFAVVKSQLPLSRYAY